ncbi:aminopeptidase P family protein [Candidatus Falkowbacteria bacterium]|nr:aminopeptidase P family protein [Candidatus Falkowbacteria bacterium]
MFWTKKQIKQHKQAAKTLNKIIDKVVEFIKSSPGITDVEIRQFIAKQYKKYHLISDKQKSIVSFGNDTSKVHYYAEQPRRLKNGDLIMIDIWARLAETGAPFADITWMLYYGRKLPERYVDVFKLVSEARDKAVKYLQSNLKNKIAPIGREADAVVRNYLAKRGHGDKFLHGTGHSLGLTSPHGARTRISKKGRQALPFNVGYTIEPGIYFKNKLGVRSEIDFYINENYKLIITTRVQNKIIKI